MAKIIVSLEGSMGQGKTTLAVALITEEQKKSPERKIISNVHLDLPNYQHFDLAWFIDNMVDTGEMENTFLYLDEMYQIADSRSSGTKINKLFSYFAVQTRKLGVDLYICTHHIDHIDLRLRRAVDIRGSCRYSEIENPCKRCKCSKCKGTGKIEGITCPVCNGKGATGKVVGDFIISVNKEKLEGVCQRCLGYGKLGMARGFFLDRRVRRRYTIEAFANDYWAYFSTKERIPMSTKIFSGIDTSEVQYT